MSAKDSIWGGSYETQSFPFDGAGLRICPVRLWRQCRQYRQYRSDGVRNFKWDEGGRLYGRPSRCHDRIRGGDAEGELPLPYGGRKGLFGEEGGGFTVPADRKTTYEGSATLSGGKVSSVTGDPLDLPAEMLSAETFDFSEENFTAVTERTGSFSAKVVRVEAFLGRAVTAEGMEVKVLYSSGRFTSMTVSYSANGAEILLSYRFE